MAGISIAIWSSRRPDFHIGIASTSVFIGVSRNVHELRIRKLSKNGVKKCQFERGRLYEHER